MIDRKRTGTIIKRIAMGVGAFLGLLLVLAIALPLIIDVDHYRPQIIAAVNQHINGTFKVDKLKLSLWGQIEIDIEGVSIKSPAGEELAAVKDTYLNISFLSVLRGQPRLVFRMQKPEVVVRQDAHGKINLLSLVKPSEASTSAPVATPTPTATTTSAPTKAEDIPLFDVIRSAVVDFELSEARFSFKSDVLGLDQKLEGFNLFITDISMSRATKIKIWSDLAIEMADKKISGPFVIDGIVHPVFEGTQLKTTDIKFDVQLEKLAIRVGELFEKASGMPARILIDLTATSSRLDLKQLGIQFFNADLNALGVVNKIDQPNPELDVKLSCKPIDLSGWSRLIPMLKEYELEGRMDMNAFARGGVAKLDYGAKLNIQDLIAKAPGLAAKPKIQINLELATNELKSLAIDFEAPGTDLAIKSSIKDFAAPRLNVSVQSNGVDLDQLFPPPKDAPAATQVAASTQVSTASQPAATPAPATDVDASLEPIRKNEFLRKSMATIAVRIKKITAMKMNVQEFALDFSLKDLVASVDNLSLFVFKGFVKSNMSVDLRPPSPAYRMNLNVGQLDLQTAIESQMPSLRNTLLGQFNMKAQGEGASLNSDKILKNLVLNGNFKIAEAKFATIDVGKMAVDGINGSLKDIVTQIPSLKDKKLDQVNGVKSRYKQIGGDFSLRQGVFLSQNFETVSYEKEGIDVKGRTEADLVNDRLKAEWMVIDTYNVTKAHDLNVDISGVKVEHLLAKGKEPVSFPVVVGCKLSAPCYDYAAIPKALGAIALENTRSAVKNVAQKHVEKAVEQVKTQVQEEQKKATEKGKDKLKEEGDKLKKRFGF